MAYYLHMDKIKKHHTQMTTAETLAIMSDVRRSNYVLTAHVRERMEQKRVNARDLEAAINNGKVMQLEKDAFGVRVLVQAVWQGDFVCAVLDMYRRKVVTAWWNNRNDRHETLDWSVYREGHTIDYRELVRA